MLLSDTPVGRMADRACFFFAPSCSRYYMCSTGRACGHRACILRILRLLLQYVTVTC